MNLHVARVGEISALAVARHCGSHVAAHSVGGEEVGVAISTGGDHHCVGRESLELSGDEVLGDDTAGTSVDNHHVKHLIAGVELHFSCVHLCGESGIGTEQKLLTSLSFSIERTAHLSTTERTVGQCATIFACERNALCHALVDDAVAHLCQTVNVGFACAVVTALHGVVEETVNGVTVVLVVLGGVDTTLSCDGVCTAWRVLNAEVQHVESHLTEGCGSGSSGEAGAHHNHVQLQLVLRIDQALMSLVVGPFLSHWSFWYS